MSLKDAIIGANLRGGIERALLEVLSKTLGDESVIDISTAEILAGHTTPIPLLPIAEAGKYYKDVVLCFEYTAGTADFEAGGAGMRYPRISYDGGGFQEEIMELSGLAMVGMFTTETQMVQVVTLSDLVTALGSSTSAQTIINKAGLFFGTNLAVINGNGSMKVKVFAVTETIG